MSSTTLYMERFSSQPLEEQKMEIVNGMQEGYVIAPELCEENLQIAGTVEVLMLVFERYYMRNSSMAVVSMQIISDGEKQTAVIVGTGGGEGILNISWGANGEFAESTSSVLESLGFEDCEESELFMGI